MIIRSAEIENVRSGATCSVFVTCHVYVWFVPDFCYLHAMCFSDDRRTPPVMWFNIMYVKTHVCELFIYLCV